MKLNFLSEQFCDLQKFINNISPLMQKNLDYTNSFSFKEFWINELLYYSILLSTVLSNRDRME